MSDIKRFIEVPLELKSISEGGDGKYGNFEGYAAVFDNLDSHRDIIRKGAFLESIAATKGIIPIIDNHWGVQLGWNKTMVEDGNGLLVQGALNLEIIRAKEQYAISKQAKELGTATGLSIGYITREFKIVESEDRDYDKRIRELLKVDLKEYSFVTFPSNNRATVRNIKSFVEGFRLNGEIDFTGDPRSLEHLLREVGFSNSLSKKVASDACNLAKKSRCEASDEGQLVDILSALKELNKKLGC